MQFFCEEPAKIGENGKRKQQVLVDEKATSAGP
jgi:hypothetical protein